jgi:hypothetical protein
MIRWTPTGFGADVPGCSPDEVQVSSAARNAADAGAES